MVGIKTYYVENCNLLETAYCFFTKFYTFIDFLLIFWEVEIAGIVAVRYNVRIVYSGIPLQILFTQYSNEIIFYNQYLLRLCPLAFML